RAIAAQADPVGIAHGRDRAEPIERAPQDDHEQARIAALGAREARDLRPRKQGAGAEEHIAAGQHMRGQAHDHPLGKSADMNNSASACWRLSARPTACITSGVTVPPYTLSMIAPGSALSAIRSATALAMSSRRPMPSIQLASSSGKPFGDDG